MKTFQKLKQNPELWERYWVREKVIDAIRAYFKGEGFHEVQTPLLLDSPSTEPFLEVFETKLENNLGDIWPAFLPTSPEYALKKLLAAGSGSIFEITKSFRNKEGRSSRHNPEFTILEWYRTTGDYMDIARDFEGLMRYILTFKDCPRKFNQLSTRISTRTVLEGELQLTYQGKIYDLSSPWEKMSVAEAFEKYSGIDTISMLDRQLLIAHGKRKGYQVTETTTWEEIWNQIIANEIEPMLGKNGPTILYDYPVAQAVLSKKKASDPRFAERFEVYMAGMELGNCFSELTDWQEQERRCLADLTQRRALGQKEISMDADFIEALKMGMPESGGIAVGIDRLAMLFADVATIDEILFFPASEMFV